MSALSAKYNRESMMDRAISSFPELSGFPRSMGVSMNCKWIIAGLVGLLISGVSAADDYQAVRDRIAGMVSRDAPISVADTPIDGLVQVQVGTEVVYMTVDARFLVQGRVLDLETQTDLTDLARVAMRRQALSSLDPSQWVRFGQDSPVHELLVFTDPDCGYCRRLHQQIDEYNQQGIRINYLAFPRAGIGSETYQKLISIWCADDQQEAMTLAKEGREIAPATCPDPPVAEQYELGQRLGVTGTPALLTTGGDLIPGYVPPEQLRERLDQLAAANGAR